MGRRPVMLVAIVLLTALAIPAFRFGRPFLAEFFLNPFQMFIVVPWALAYWCVRSGSMPLKHGGRIDRAAAPVQFWTGVWFMAAAGTMFFVLNLWLAWMVVSR